MGLVEQQLAKIGSGSAGRQVVRALEAERAAAPGVAQPTDGGLGELIAHRNASDAAAQAAAETQRAHQAQLEAEHGQLATIGTQLGRGALDAVLAPGALFGATLEGLGSLTGDKGTEALGRDIGRSSNADAGIEAAAFLFGGGGKHGLTTAERVSRDINEQQQAWPALSALSHTGGMIGVGALGGLASGGSRAAATIAAAGLESAAGGAQGGYERNESLRDVLSSAMVAGVLGAGAGAAGEGLSALVRSPALRAASRELAEDANLRATGIGREDLVSMFGPEAGKAEAKASQLASELSTYRFQSGPMEGKPIIRAFRTPEGIREGVAAAQAETSQVLDGARAHIAEQALANPDMAPLAATIRESDDAAEHALQALGGNLEEFQAMRQQSQSFKELSALIEKASQSGGKESGTLGNMLGAAATIGGFVHGVPSLPAIAHGLLTKVGSKVVEQRAASTVAALANSLTLDTVSSALQKVVPVVTGASAGTGRAASSLGKGAKAAEKPAPPLTPQQKQDRYRDQLDKVNKAVNQPDAVARMDLVHQYADLPAPLLIAASADMSQKMAQLHADMPKPVPNLRGKAYETLSSEQVRLANAMYEATTNPMSVFSDFAAGRVDYDKVRYAWKQYPGLQQAAQAGLMDILQTQMTEESRARVSDGTLTQLDNLFGFNGALQPTNDRGFAGRMTQLGAQSRDQQNQPPPPRGGKIETPLAQPTFTQRLSGQR